MKPSYYAVKAILGGPLQPGDYPGAKVIKAYVVETTNDERGGRGGVVGVFSNKTEAEVCNQTAGWYGGAGILSETIAVVIDDRTYLLRGDGTPVDIDKKIAHQATEEWKAAMAKLSEKDKEILGLKDKK